MNFDYLGLFIRSFRQANDETLQSLADRSGVSRSMISQIESGQKSPTIVVLAKLAIAMNIRLEDLVKAPNGTDSAQVLTPSKDNIVSKEGSVFVCHLLVAKFSSSSADLYHFYFTAYGKTSFSANKALGTTKYIWVEQGELTVILASKKVTAKAGQALKFDASIPHRFECRAGELVKGTFFVAYPR
ncbi:XRE family transcriptional regulator [Pseudoalteromonas citrea]|uniref:XRE family transcriptional regulator n=1 Tax=Pseudoalteromonas citrea TaxID=43655 RepID=A0A5S3XJF5_9GAMM|nr:XRE family transcriptional regulator [Pseudoalteromonas citrea]TMP41950.1 XRE family transcriptional regulator [Pseudoalteromonas citrea]TMP54507.1 XRE family transcriptional regulator [Pseudoalteromonas citrea]